MHTAEFGWGRRERKPVTVMAYSMCVNIIHIHVHGHSLRPDKVDLLFLITYFFNLDVGGRAGGHYSFICTSGACYNYALCIRTRIIAAAVHQN